MRGGSLFARVNRYHIRVTLIWAGGLLIVFTLGILWLGLLGLAVFTLYRDYREYGAEVGSYVRDLIPLILVLVLLGAAIKWFVNRFYDWWVRMRVKSIMDTVQPVESLEQSLDCLVEKYQSEVSLEFSETFKHQLQSSPTFQATLNEATRLAFEVLSFYNAQHTDEERYNFQKAWQAKAEKFAERVANGDPLAVEVILKAIEKESKKERVAGK